MSYSYQKQFKKFKHMKSVFKWWSTYNQPKSLFTFYIGSHVILEESLTSLEDNLSRDFWYKM